MSLWVILHYSQPATANSKPGVKIIWAICYKPIQSHRYKQKGSVIISLLGYFIVAFEHVFLVCVIF